MRFVQLREVFDLIKQVHQEASVCCEESSHSDDERLNLLAEFFRGWEARLGEYVAAWEESDRNGALNTWVPFLSTERILHALSLLRLEHCLDKKMFLGRCFELQDEIVALLQEMAENLDAAHARELLLEVAKFEQQAARKLASAELTELDA
jgi:hypothetical protein